MRRARAPITKLPGLTSPVAIVCLWGRGRRVPRPALCAGVAKAGPQPERGLPALPASPPDRSSAPRFSTRCIDWIRHFGEGPGCGFSFLSRPGKANVQPGAPLWTSPNAAWRARLRPEAGPGRQAFPQQREQPSLFIDPQVSPRDGAACIWGSSSVRVVVTWPSWPLSSPLHPRARFSTSPPPPPPILVLVQESDAFIGELLVGWG